MIEFWPAILIGSASVFSWKILGYLLPEKFAKNTSVVIFAGKLTIALLAALTAVQTFVTGQTLVLDSRLAALGVAALLYWRKVPFIVAVAVAAVVAALLRHFLAWP
ncbi:MAG: AzlD domain-containing protein [Micrococcales bacterium]